MPRASCMAEVMAQTPRLVLRTWDAGDIAPFKQHLNTPAVMQWLGGVADDAEFMAFYDRVQLCQQSHGHSFWIVERRDDGALLGFCGLKRVNSDGATMTGDFEIGWRLREDAWGHGYAREAAEATLDAAFGTFDAPHVVALTVRGNAASWGLMQRLGMARARELDFTGGFAGPGEEQVIVYKIDRKEWMQ
jgi:RimJ/RimL family protein N-acetyltransferase